MEIWKNIGQSFYCQGLADHKILWDSRTLKDLGISILKKVKAFQLNFWQKSRWCWSNKNTENGEVAFSTCCLLQSKCLYDLSLLLLCCPLWRLGTLINQIPVVEIRHIFLMSKENSRTHYHHKEVSVSYIHYTLPFTPVVQCSLSKPPKQKIRGLLFSKGIKWEHWTVIN